MTLSAFAVALYLGSPAILVSLSGNVQVDVGTGPVTPARFAEIPERALVMTHEGSLATLRLASGSLVRLGPKTSVILSQLELSEPAARRKERIKLVVGRLWARVMRLFGNEAAFEVETGNAVAGVRGTSFWAVSEDAGDELVLDDGSLSVRAASGETLLAGPGAVVRAGAEGLGVASHLAPAGLHALRLSTGGIAAVLARSLEQRDVERASRSAARDRLRQDIIGPDGLIDTPLAGTAPTDEVGNTAELTVHLRIPPN